MGMRPKHDTGLPHDPGGAAEPRPGPLREEIPASPSGGVVERPHLRLVLAISLDGRLAPPQGGAAQIGGRGDRRVLEEALAWADAALLGAEALRRHGCTCLIHAPDLLAARALQGRSPQPVALVASRSGHLPAELPFFAQPLERWLLRADGAGPDDSPTRRSGIAEVAACQGHPGFTRVRPLTVWSTLLRQLGAEGLTRIAVLGGAALVASLLEQDLLDELQLTLCPRLLGGGHGWLPATALVPDAASRGWRLLEQRPLEGEELLLRYGRAQAAP